MQLEAYNPEPSTSMAGELLAGKWKLVYTSNSELYPLLLADELPFVTIGDITQTISADSLEVTNRLAVEVPFLKFGVRAGAALQLRSASARVRRSRDACTTGWAHGRRRRSGSCCRSW